MTIQAQIEGGDTLEFPDGTDPAVINRVVKAHIAGTVSSAAADQPAVAPTAVINPPSDQVVVPQPTGWARGLQNFAESIGRRAAEVVGTPLDMVNQALDIPGHIINAVTGQQTVPPLYHDGGAVGALERGGASLERAAGLPDIALSPGNKALDTIAGAATQMGAAGGLGALLESPAAVSRLGPIAATIGNALTSGDAAGSVRGILQRPAAATRLGSIAATVGDALTSGVAKDTALGAGTGVGQVAANAIDPNHQHPVIDTALTLGSTILTALGLAGPQAIATGAGKLAGTEAAATNRAARSLNAAVPNKWAPGTLAGAVLNNGGALDNMANAAERFAGTDFKPTLGQASNDPGLIAQENGLRSSNPAPFMQRTRDNNTAITGELAKNNPVEYETPANAPVGAGTGNPVSTILQGQTKAAVDAAQAKVDQANAELAAARKESSSAAQAFTPTGQSSEAASETVRGAVQGAKDQATGAYRDTLESAKADPEGKLNFLPDNIVAAADQVKKDAPNLLLPTAYQGHIGTILSRLSGKSSLSMNDLVGLDQDLNQVMRTAAAQSDGLTIAKLSPVKDAVNRTLLEMQDPAALSAAHLPQAQADLDALTANKGIPTAESPDADIQAYIQQRVSQGATAGQALREMQTGAPAGATNLSPEDLAAKTQQAQGRVDLLKNYAADPDYFSRRVNAYTGSRQNYAENTVPSFSQGTTRSDLQAGANGEDYRRAPDVGRFFRPGPEGGPAMDQLTGIIGDNPEAMNAVNDWVTRNLGETVTKADGSIKPEALTNWINNHQKALSRVPDLKAQIMQMRNRAMSATAKEGDMEDAVRAATANLGRTADEQNRSAASFFTSSTGAPQDPVKAAMTALDSGNARANIADLARRAAQDKSGEATLGLRKAVYDAVEQKVTNAGSTYASADASAPVSLAKANKELAKVSGALDPLYTPEEKETLARVRDMIQTQSNTMLRGSVGSNTAEKSYMTANLARATASTIAGYKFGLVARILAHATGARLQAASDKVLTRAYLDPDFARSLMTRDLTPAAKTKFIAGAQMAFGVAGTRDGSNASTATH
ncbi:MAG TPA: hypothetical protein VMU87_09380 [Stellaceae bacterium]|nr:hypothetical protein [Stellaceae bacterium]